jgi:superfamily II DNA or RNA helicase
MADIKPLHEMSRVITTKGYAILKSAITEAQIAKLRKELTVAPKVNAKFACGNLAFTIFLESATRFYVPRQWGIKQFGEPDGNIIGEGLDLPDTIEFIGSPYPYQQTIIDTFIDKGANGLICVPCGRGKTFMALCAAITIGKRFLIVVDKEFLANQWKGEIERYIKGARVGVLQANKCQVDPAKYDITICMLQTVCQRDFSPAFFENYGLTIFDECHHLGAAHFSKVMIKIQTQWLLGLSATPDRDDGLTKVFEYFLGEPVYQETTREPDPTVEVEAIWYRNSDPAYATPPVNWKGEIVTARLMTQIVECKLRTFKIVERLFDLAENDSRRKILVLSERRAHLEELHDSPELSKFIRGYYIGGMKQADLDRNADTCQMLFATYAMSAEAMNIPTLNSMIMASPRKKVEQATGRILRVKPENRAIQPLIIDIIDQHSMYENQWYQRARYYKKCKYAVRHMNKPDKTLEDRAALDKKMGDQCMIHVPVLI